MIIAIDFDNTIAHTAYPVILSPLPGAIETIRYFQQAGHVLILWTCREGEDLRRALQWLKQFGIVFNFINQNPTSDIEEWGVDTRKVFADFYIDDKNIDCKEVDWAKIKQIIERAKK